MQSLLYHKTSSAVEDIASAILHIVSALELVFLRLVIKLKNLTILNQAVNGTIDCHFILPLEVVLRQIVFFFFRHFRFLIPHRGALSNKSFVIVQNWKVSPGAQLPYTRPVGLLENFIMDHALLTKYVALEDSTCSYRGLSCSSLTKNQQQKMDLSFTGFS
jgi:hypothetical protein